MTQPVMAWTCYCCQGKGHHTSSKTHVPHYGIKYPCLLCNETGLSVSVSHDVCQNVVYDF